jgi:uncharacterized protein (DUF305 family)
MNSTTQRRLALPALALAGALVLTACGGEDTASTGSSSSEHGGGHSSDKNTDSTASDEANEADIEFLTGMIPHHDQAVEMSDIVLAANPPAEVAAIARQIKGAQDPEIEQMNAMLKGLGKESAGEHSGGHSAGHGGMMSEQDMADLKAATGTEAARLYLEAMIEHHQGAIDASNAELAEGKYEPARELAQEIKTAQQAEIDEMQELLRSL